MRDLLFSVRHAVRGLRQQPGFTVVVLLILLRVLAEGLMMTAAGLVLGLAGALAYAHVLADRLYQTSATDAGVLLTVSGLILCSALASSWVPARRVTRITRLPR